MQREWLQAVNRVRAWVMRDAHRAQMRAARAELHRAFTEHPASAGETYLEHLWFTSTMSARFFYTTMVILVHGLFPFLLTRAASAEIEAIYRIMKTRIPKARREVIDAAHDDYVV